jgi:hypothetical protein
MSLSHDSMRFKRWTQGPPPGTLDVQVDITREQGMDGPGVDVYPMEEYSSTWISHDDDEFEKKPRR